MIAPTFDAHGWCHDMDAAPRDGIDVMLWAQPESWMWPAMMLGEWCHSDNRWWTNECDTDSAPPHVIAWRPQLLPPEGAE
jgi:hypothetical protein